MDFKKIDEFTKNIMSRKDFIDIVMEVCSCPKNKMEDLRVKYNFTRKDMESIMLFSLGYGLCIMACRDTQKIVQGWMN